MRLEVRRFDAPDEVHDLDGGSLATVTAGGLTLALATYPPGWRWSREVGARTGRRSCPAEHVVFVLAGRARITMDDGRAIEVGPGDLCAVPGGHDFEVLEGEAYRSLHLVGREGYVEASGDGG